MLTTLKEEDMMWEINYDEVTVDFALKRQKFRQDFIEFLKTKVYDIER